MKTRIAIIESNILGSWDIVCNGQLKHSGKLNPASLRYRAKCLENLKKFYSEVFPNGEMEVVIMNTDNVTVVRNV